MNICFLQILAKWVNQTGKSLRIFLRNTSKSVLRASPVFVVLHTLPEEGDRRNAGLTLAGLTFLAEDKTGKKLFAVHVINKITHIGFTACLGSVLFDIFYSFIFSFLVGSRQVPVC